MIKLVRCDDRLIHGQCLANIVRVHHIDNILVIDDETVKNPVLKMLFSAAVPPTLTAEVCTMEQSIKIVQAAEKDQSVSLILMKSPTTCLWLFKQIDGLPEEINIGPARKREETVMATEYCYLTKEEVFACRELEDNGIKVYFQQMSNQPITEWISVDEKIKEMEAIG